MAKNEKTETETENDGATAVSRATNKLRQLTAATLAIGEKALSAKLAECGAALEKLGSSEKGAQLESELRRKRGSDFEPGMRVRIKDQFVALYGKSATPHVVEEVQTIGGDENKRGGRSFLKVKTSAGLTIVAPASCFDLA